MSGVPIGILIIALLIIIPVVKILRAKYASLKERLVWFSISLLGLPIGLLLGYLQRQSIQNAQTEVEKIQLLMSMSPLPNNIMTFWTLIVFFIFRYMYLTKRKSKSELLQKS